MRHLLLAVAIATIAPAALASGAACWSDDSVQAVAAIKPTLSARSEELVRMAISEAVSGDGVYALSRQMVLLERIHRFVLERGNCAYAADSIGRDFAILKRIFSAYAEGDAELDIEALKAEQSQALLGEIQRLVSELGAALTAIGADTAGR